MIIWYSLLLALTLFCTVVNLLSDKPGLALFCALSSGLNLGMILSIVVGK